MQHRWRSNTWCWCFPPSLPAAYLPALLLAPFTELGKSVYPNPPNRDSPRSINLLAIQPCPGPQPRPPQSLTTGGRSAAATHPTPPPSTGNHRQQVPVSPTLTLVNRSVRRYYPTQMTSHAFGRTVTSVLTTNTTQRKRVKTVLDL